MGKTSPKSAAYTTFMVAGMLFVICLIGVGGIGFLFINEMTFTPASIASSIPVETSIEMTFSAAGSQTAESYSPPPPTKTPIPTIALLPTITFAPTATFQLIPSLSPPTSSPTVAPTDSGCDPGDQLPYVYSPDRLIVWANCIRVTGIVDEIEYHADGDLHILLRLDREYQYLLKRSNPGNKYLVVEPICVTKPIQPNAIKACALNPNPLKNLPKVRDHVWMEGRYVTDSFHNGWAEIHPLARWDYYYK